jgi:hypothetical protein
MFIITRPATIDWLDRMVEFEKADPANFSKSSHTFAQYIAMHRGQPMAFNDFLATVGLHVFLEYLDAQHNPITLNDNDNPNPSGPLGSDQGPNPQS